MWDYWFKLELIELIEKNLYEIKIEIIEKEPNLKIIDKYQDAINLYNEGYYSEAFRKARDIFQDTLNNDFNSSIKHFAKKSDDLSKLIDKLLYSISEIRNRFAKHIGFENMEPFEQRAICKLSIEQLISIQQFIKITNNDNDNSN
ncbi:hypothetical protein ASO20_02955 [Mycoplasma sp. (ex Biomphalaria glabrata)]|uniref:hypothetical protein n=1 Tax=Mycoplasma sp. (ex Biomphalaria glabrata) TaxID=1749074 RepID=UPI00073AA213|nr:hypothetical protein [Mycoplasma sp. (ex Biomphalaria glabrata)]ALV23592.1 hypothetical protein ASO20_02955 [Mycoplasma sp. (ex Biomphalaria glabrata)]